MKWTDVYDIAIELGERYPDVNPQYVNFVDLHKWVCDLDGFNDDQDRLSLIHISEPTRPY